MINVTAGVLYSYSSRKIFIYLFIENVMQFLILVKTLAALASSKTVLSKVVNIINDKCMITYDKNNGNLNILINIKINE